MKQGELSRKGRNAAVLLLLLVCLFFFGVGGYMLLEKVVFLEAMYLTIGTLTTVAPFKLTGQGQLFAIVLILFGFGLVAATAAFIGNMFLDGSWIAHYRRRKVQKELHNYKNHYIICGYGQVGNIVADELHGSGIPIVVIDKNTEVIAHCREAGIMALQRDAMEEENLVEAGLERAKGLISVVNRDADNVFIVLTARAVNEDLFIFARASSKGVEKKLYRAGANHVVSPYASAAVRITQNILRPTITDFLGSALSSDNTGMELALEELEIPENAPFAGKTLMDSDIRNDFDLIVVAIKRKDGSRIFNPSSLECINKGDTLIAVGPRKNINTFLERVGKNAADHQDQTSWGLKRTAAKSACR
ncbi:MAG: potassium channel protein [Desulfobacteraceae bacterium]